MSTSQNIVIKDACILFDLIDLDLLEAFYKLDVTAVTTNFVIGEILDEAQAIIVQQNITEGKLIIYNDGAIDMIIALNDQNPGLSLADCSVIELALRVPGIILSSDKSLRNEARRRQLVVKGLLWVLNQLVERKMMTKEECLVKLEQYPLVNPRAPRKDIQLLIAKLNSL